MSKRSMEHISEAAAEDVPEHQSKRSKKDQHIPNPQATLLGLPGELRNRIYRFALIEEHRVKLDSTNHTLPPLLRTCRQIRREATSIHLQENRFGINIHDLNPQAPIQSSGHWYTRTAYTVSWTGVPVWENLKTWMELRYRHELCGAKSSDRDSYKALSGVAGSASRMVKQMKAKGMTWEDNDPVLESYKIGVEASHGRGRFWV